MSALRSQRIPHPSVSCDLRNIIPSVHWTMVISFSMSTFKASVHTYLRMKTQCLEDECLHLVAKEGSATQTWVWHTEVLFLPVLHWMGLSECKSDMDKHITGLNTVQGWGGNITVVACTIPMMPWCGSGSEWLHWTVLWVSAEQRQRLESFDQMELVSHFRNLCDIPVIYDSKTNTGTNTLNAN